jgi:hypothetical protein
VLLDDSQRLRLALEGGKQLARLQPRDVLEVVAERLSYPDCLAPETDDYATDQRMGVALVATHAGRRAHPVAHSVDAQLRPADSPEIGRRGRPVERCKKAMQFLDPWRYASVDFADKEGGGLEVTGHRSANAAWFIEINGKVVSNDASNCPAPPNDAGDRLLVDRILSRDDKSLCREVWPDKSCTPFGVVGLAGDDRDVDRPFLREALHLGHMHRRNRDGVRLLIRHA